MAATFNCLNPYWRRRSYQRLEDLQATRKNIAVVRLGGGRNKSSWPQLRVVSTPKKVLVRIRDAYLDAMLLLSGGGGGGAATNKSGGGGPVWDRRIPRARQASSRGVDFEKRIMLHLYSSVIATR
ncbi:hypothetical protein KSP39_PZI008394 [Platanthera zijinensis]|uniref:Uncharacterized protein n=1 Tax=Platanthera zijinensis TaxID=2320716 RepID=A0AAP0BNK4_9ASPA